MKKNKFNIQGMTCSSCQAHVQKAVENLNGIKNVNVNLLSNSMIVEYDEKTLNDKKIIEAVKNEGYGATLAINSQKDKIQNDNENTLNSMKKRLIISICFWIPLMYVAMYHMFYDLFGIPVPKLINDLFHGPENAITFGFTQILLLIPIIYVNRNYFIIGFKRLFKLSPNMDSLIAIGSFSAIIYGIYAIYMIGFGLGHNNLELVSRFSNDLYFESAGTILTLITVGKYLETKSKGKTSEAINKLINLAPKTAIVLKNEKEIEIEVKDIKKEDIIIIKPGYSIPVDGIIIEGESSIDESTITGESIPTQKSINDKVISGTINKNGYFKMKATEVGDDTTLAQIIKLVEEAANSKAPISRLADKVSGVFVPIVITIALLTTIFWLINGQSFEFALSIGIAVLVISCPCALGLATPVAIMVGTGKGAELGILIKSAESLELLHKVDTVVLDKTGTITQGKPKVIDIITNQDLINEVMSQKNKVKVVLNKNNDLTSKNNLLKIAGSLEKNSEHPLAEAIIEKTRENNLNLYEVKDFEAISGRGVRGKIDNIEYFGGNLAFMQENNVKLEDVLLKAEELSKQGKTLLYFAKENRLLGIIAVADTIKPTSKIAISELKKKNLEVIMITGDNKNVAESIGKNLEIDKVISEVMPQDKEREVTKLQASGKRVAFVGDGINDSPALVRSDVGIAISSGTDIAVESADIVLINDDLLSVVSAISLSKKVINNIKMSLFWAFFYNIIGIPVAAGLFYLSFNLKLNPMIGAAAMSLSSVCVVLNALRLKKFKPEFKKCDSENLDNKERKIMKKLIVNGMSCNHCKMSVEKALKKIDSVEDVEVNLETKEVIISSNKEIDNKVIEETIKEAGFEVSKFI
ncbi:MAG TPA: heavy metal translocating P-type ATPase [Candidatus Scatovivens faecipullorum]|nr:heavy metal translocating P-type ATPase [Candidatus Scatovivens faecipullorum]